MVGPGKFDEYTEYPAELIPDESAEAFSTAAAVVSAEISLS